MQVIADWLDKLGLGQYAQRFAENDISFSVLSDLTDQHLKEIGLSLGHQLQLLRAIAELPSREKDAAKTAAVTAASSTPQDIAERRQVTVMFSDLVGSTALSARMDPEDLREVISAYQKCVAEAVQRFDGFVAKYMGDGVLVYFGYPQAHEDDAERAVRAGLELIKRGWTKSGAPLQTRVGISTGLVVVGDLIGSGAAQEQAVVGETPNLAARLQSDCRAEHGSDLREYSKAPRQSVRSARPWGKGPQGHRRAERSLGSSTAKLGGEPLRGAARDRPDRAGRARRRTRIAAAPLVEGKDRRRSGGVALRRAGHRQIAACGGTLERLAGEPYTRLRYFCSPQHTDSALYPMIVGQLEHAAGFTYDDTSLAKLDKLDALLAQFSTPREEVALFAEMLSLPNDGRYPRLELTPQQRRQRTLEALTAQIEARSREKPVLMIFEDVHWIDPTSLEALGQAVDRIRTLRVLLIVTYRPEFEPPWIGRPHVTALILNRLGDREIAAIIEGVIGNKPLRASIRKGIIERTDGIPLFVEEMTKSVLEAVGEGVTEGAGAGVLPPSVAVPASLHASLMARLDRLGAAKEIAQIGAAIGREFSHALLAAVASKPEVVVGNGIRPYPCRRSALPRGRSAARDLSV